MHPCIALSRSSKGNIPNHRGSIAYDSYTVQLCRRNPVSAVFNETHGAFALLRDRAEEKAIVCKELLAFSEKNKITSHQSILPSLSPLCTIVPMKSTHILPVTANIKSYSQKNRNIWGAEHIYPSINVFRLGLGNEDKKAQLDRDQMSVTKYVPNFSCPDAIGLRLNPLSCCITESPQDFTCPFRCHRQITSGS